MIKRYFWLSVFLLLLVSCSSTDISVNEGIPLVGSTVITEAAILDGYILTKNLANPTLYLEQLQSWQESYASILRGYKERYDYLHFSIHDIDLDGIPELFIIGYGIDVIYTFRDDEALRLEYGEGIYEITIHLVAARTGITTMPTNQPGIITYGFGAGSPFGASIFLRRIVIDGDSLIVDAFGSIIIDPQNGYIKHLINGIAVSETELWQKFGHSFGQQFAETGSVSPLPQTHTLTEISIQKIIFGQ